MEYIITKEQYLAVIATWAQIKSHSAEEHIIYNALRGFDLKRGFAPVTNEIKKANGTHPWHGYINSVLAASWMLREPTTVSTRFRLSDVEIQRRTDREEARLQHLNARFGFEFTPELREEIREMLK